MDKAAFLERLRRGRAELEQAFAELTPEQWLQAVPNGAWSPKDVLAHITWHEREMIGVIEGMALLGSEWWGLPTDERNARIFEANRERTWQDVVAEAQQVYPRLLAALEGLDEAAYQDAGLYREMPAEWAPWDLFAGNTFEHYEQHLQDLSRASQ